MKPTYPSVQQVRSFASWAVIVMFELFRKNAPTFLLAI